jgi:hypothetical protein
MKGKQVVYEKTFTLAPREKRGFDIPSPPTDKGGPFP